MTTDESAIRAELRSLAEQYARGVDRRDDVEGFVALFLPDAVITIHDPSESTEPRELRGSERLARIPEVIKRYPKTFHMLGQSTYSIGDGEATGEVYCIAHHLTPDQHGRRHRLRDVHPVRGHVPPRRRRRVEVRAPAPARRLDRDAGSQPTERVRR